MKADTLPRLLLLIAGEDNRSDGLRRIPVAMVARGYKEKQKFAVTLADLASIVKNYRKRGTGDLVIDYDHSTEFAAGAGEPVPAAGWLKQIEDAPDANGVLWGLAQFTERAAKMLAAREYKYFSPVLVWGARDKNTGEPQGTTLTSIALTNSPLMEKLPAFAFSDASWQIERGSAPQKEEGRVIATVEDAKNELKNLQQQMSTAIANLMSDRLLSYADAVKQAHADNPDLPERERQLMDLLRNGVPVGDSGTLISLGRESALQGVEAELDRRARAKMVGSDIQYHEALKLVARENPDMDRQRARIFSGELTSQAQNGQLTFSERANALKLLETNLDSMTRAKMAGSNLQYGDALKLVAAENPHIDQQRTRLIRGSR